MAIWFYMESEKRGIGRQGTVKFIQEGRYKFIPYHKLFRRTEMIHIPGHGYFEGYANRDSLQYLDVYEFMVFKPLQRDPKEARLL